MKEVKIPLIVFLLTSIFCSAQQAQIEEKSILKNYESMNISSAKVLSKAENWFSNEENAGLYEIVMIDQEQGILIAEGSSKVLYKNIGKEMYPKRTGMAEVLEAVFGTRIAIQTSEEGFSIMYEVVDMKKEMYHKEALFYDCINFVEVNDVDVDAYNESMNKLLKANMVFKKRRDIFTENSRKQFEEVSSFLLNEGELILFSLHEAITSE